MTAEPIPLRRNYAAEMRELLDAESTGEPAPVIAERVVHRLLRQDRDLLDGWLHSQAVNLLRDAIGTIDRSGRAHARAMSRRSVFADDAAGGDVQGWLTARYVLVDGSRPTLAEMTADDLRYVAAQYDCDAKAARMEAAFMRAVAKKVGGDTVADHFSEQQIAELRRSLTPA